MSMPRSIRKINLDAYRECNKILANTHFDQSTIGSITHFNLLFDYAVRENLIKESCFKCTGSKNIHIWLQSSCCFIFTLVYSSNYIWTQSTSLTISLTDGKPISLRAIVDSKTLGRGSKRRNFFFFLTLSSKLKLTSQFFHKVCNIKKQIKYN